MDWWSSSTFPHFRTWKLLSCLPSEWDQHDGSHVSAFSSERKQHDLTNQGIIQTVYYIENDNLQFSFFLFDRWCIQELVLPAMCEETGCSHRWSFSLQFCWKIVFTFCISEQRKTSLNTFYFYNGSNDYVLMWMVWWWSHFAVPLSSFSSLFFVSQPAILLFRFNLTFICRQSSSWQLFLVNKLWQTHCTLYLTRQS